MEGLGFFQLAFAALVVMLAFAVRGTTGFGGGAIGVPLLALVLPIHIVIPVITVLTIFSSLGHWLKDWRRIVWKEIAAIGLSTLAGVVGTLFGGAAGPLYVIYLNALRLEKDAFRVTVTTMLLTLATLRVIGYSGLGFYNPAPLTVLAAALPMMLIGARIGNHVAGRINQRAFNRVVGLVLMVSGAALILK
ncbi:MAG: sulfite exporter TauE/SafE family protein [Betaproteobacteria bacterium]|nr:sulfite exporter TauE/SafE family protein [Betaproteobacteria bacterium]